jgi:hypothetical protein
MCQCVLHYISDTLFVLVSQPVNFKYELLFQQNVSECDNPVGSLICVVFRL